MLVKVLGVVALVVAVQTASVTNEGAQGRQLDNFFLDVITLGNDECTSSEDAYNGQAGSCITTTECNKEHGIHAGSCAKDFGVCCLKTGDITIGDKGGVFRSKKCTGKDGCPEAGVYKATLTPPEGTKQIKLYFDDFMLAPPSEGDCSNDTFVVVGANDGEEIPVICGDNKGQHMYINIDDSEGPFKLLTTLSNADIQRSWDINVKYLAKAEAPRRCLQYHAEEEGEIKSFNYGKDSPMHLNDQMYSICFGYVKGKCDIGLNFDRLDLGDINGNCGNFDYLAVGHERLCGFKNDFTKTANATGPQFLTLHIVEENSIEANGFKSSYMMMDC